MAEHRIRIPDDLTKALKEAADKNVRSLNGEITARLTASLKK